MNGIIALCHFCEYHGPRVLFCTQAVHSSEPYGVDSSIHTNKGLEHLLKQYQSDDDVCHGNENDLELCLACRSLDKELTGYISRDPEAHVKYISTQYPHNPELKDMVQLACTRSLSCEVYPGKEGALFYGDSACGHVISYKFSLKNLYARGCKQWYSAMIVMMDKVYLLNMWPFLIEQLKDIINKLKLNTDAVFQLEQSNSKPIRMNKCPTSLNISNSKASRSLKELTNSHEVFIQLHQRFTWILKAGSTRLTEKLLEGPPTEDSVIDYEKQELTEEGFVKLYSKNDNPEIEFKDVGMNTSSWQDATPGCSHHSPDISPINRCEFKSLRHLLSVLKGQKFQVLAHHVLIGNQAIIRGGNMRLVCSVVNALKKLLPLACCRLINFSDHYEDVFTCNILGLAQGISVPSTAKNYVVLDIIEPETAEEATEDVSIRSSVSSSTSTLTAASIQETPITTRMPSVEEMDSFHGYIFILTTPLLLDDSFPAVLEQMMASLQDFKLAESVVEQCLICIKEEWMNKVKLLFKFTKAGGRRVEDDTRHLMQIIGAQSKDKQLLDFWRTGLSLQYRNQLLETS